MLRDEDKFQSELEVANKDFKKWRRTSEYRDFAAVVAAQTRAFTKNCAFVITRSMPSRLRSVF